MLYLTHGVKFTGFYTKTEKKLTKSVTFDNIIDQDTR